jgi:hypothetical protein
MSTDTAVGNRGTPAEQPAHTKAPRRWWRILLTVVLVLIVLGLVGAGIRYYRKVGAIKSSEPYQLALRQVQQDKKLIEHIGQPIRDPFVVDSLVEGLGTITTQGEEGRAELTFPVAGPKGSATIRLEAERKEGKWRLKILNGTPAGGHTIPLDMGEASGLDVAPVFGVPGGKEKPKETGKNGESPPPKIDLTVPEM